MIQTVSNTSLHLWRSVWRYFLPLAPIKTPLTDREAGQDGVSYLQSRPGILDLGVGKALGTDKPSLAQLSNCQLRLVCYTEYANMALRDNGDKGQ